MRIAGLVLAAGAGTRMGGPKADLPVGGRTLLDHALSALTQGGCSPVLAVVRPAQQAPVGAPDAPDALGGSQLAPRTRRPGPSLRVVNPEPDRGMRSSLLLGLEAAPACAAVAVALVDTPGLTAAAVATVIGAWTPGRIAVARARGRRAHPVVMSPAMWLEAVVLAEPDEGARRFLRAHPERVDEVEVDIDPADLDTPEDLAAWRERTGTT